MPLTLITEYPDETLHGEAFRAAHRAQMETVLAAYDALQETAGLDHPNVAPVEMPSMVHNSR